MDFTLKDMGYGESLRSYAPRVSTRKQPGECIELARRGGKKQRLANLGHHLVAI